MKSYIYGHIGNNFVLCGIKKPRPVRRLVEVKGEIY